MNRPPRKPKETIFTKEVKTFLLSIILIGSPLLLLVFLGSLWQGVEVEVARTRLFIVFIFFELVLALNCRSLVYPVWKEKPHKFLLAAVLWEVFLIFTLINIPAAREALGIAFLGILELVLVAVLSAVTFLSMEFLKHLLHKHLQQI